MSRRARDRPVRRAWRSVAGCGGTLDAGRDMPHGLLPVDERNPVIIENDRWSDNWMGEYAMLLANSGGPPLVGIIASATPLLAERRTTTRPAGRKLVTAARASGLQNIPDVTTSEGLPLVRPADGQIDSTVRNDSAGARLIVELSRQLSLPRRPVVVLACAPLTTLADAYLHGSDRGRSRGRRGGARGVRRAERTS